MDDRDSLTFYRFADYTLSGSELGEVIEFYVSPEEAEAALRDVLIDEPEWEDELAIEIVELAVSPQ